MENKAIVPNEFELIDIGLENFAPYLMNRIMGRYNVHVRQDMVSLGLSTPKMRALATLVVMDGTQIGELAEFSVVEQSTLSRALDALEQANMVRRISDTSDNRATKIFITDQGRAAFKRLWPRMAESYAQMFRGIGEKERQVFIETLQTILRNVHKHKF